MAKKEVHLLPAWREQTYCGLDPGVERARGYPVKTTATRSKVTCEGCKGLPKE